MNMMTKSLISLGNSSEIFCVKLKPSQLIDRSETISVLNIL